MDYNGRLKDICLKMGVELDDDMSDKFKAYADILVEWNEKMNLTAITDKQEIDLKHFADSLSLISAFNVEKGASVIDVGTGAGFPGLPIKIALPDIRLTLLDSLNKRVDFLNFVAESLNLQNVECIRARAEDGGQDENLREKFDICVSRAVAKLSVLAEYCLPFVKEGGFFIALKGFDCEEEAEEARNALKILGGEIQNIHKLSLPETDIRRGIIIIKKVSQTPSKYPRKAGKPTKKPL